MSLVLTRKPGQGVTFSGPDSAAIHVDVDVEYYEGKFSRVKLYIDAPTNWRVMRDELIKAGSSEAEQITRTPRLGITDGTL